MSVSTKHPEYTAERAADWRLCRDAYEGETAFKAAGSLYLPKPSGYSKAAGHTDDGQAAYAAYKARAEFPEILGPSIGAMVGIIHGTEIQIDIPDALTYLHENANGQRKTLVDFHREITRQLLIAGRYGVLADAPQGGGDPFLAGYEAQTIINWDDGFYVLDETADVREGFLWKRVEQYRVLQMEEGRYVQVMHSGGTETDVTPTMQGGGGLSRVPFVVASATDLEADIETPPMIGIARAAKAAYQLSADYRLQLYMSGQETLVAINGAAPQAVGAGVVHEMHGSEQMTPDLKYVSPSCAGIEAHKVAIEHCERRAVMAGARMFEQSEQAQESGEARALRFKSETANLKTVAQSSCSLLERALRNVAMMKGLPEDSVTVTPPEDLLDATIEPQQAAQLWTIVKEGGLSYETFYERLQKGGIASPERTADEEYELAAQKVFEGEALV
ncbi:DUF4055 domain-containing protein [Salipiger thiooxidans]|uniref:DUF4055 domain-containing protein n=1 Tax=Salipiger thiooxidans TaxID=282683 RepID=UPI001A905046|nr:DUF4055 domain-containing protein [Salipiger thiooxidans]MBN8189536.1 DUF4055 domain-containing protein [Salipiger thiooxidans]